jgi:hypothetical protein
MGAENPNPTSREEEIRALDPDHPLNTIARDTVLNVKRALETQSGNYEFSIVVNGGPFFEVKPALGGRSGINVSLACLEDGEYHELLLRLKYTGDPLKSEVTWPDFIKALTEQERRVGIQCSFDAEPGERVPIILEDREGRIVVNKTEITGLRYMDKE